MRILFALFLTLSTLTAQERIITLSPSLSEIVFALEKGDELVGVSSFSSYPQEVLEIEKIGGYFNPNLEKILSLHPTLVIAQEHSQKFLSQLSALGIPTLIVKLNTLEDIEESIVKVAGAIGAKNAQVLVDKIECARAKAPKLEKPESVLIVFGVYYDLRSNIYVSGNELYFEQMLESCNATNAYTPKGFSQPVLGYEQIVALNPDKIILLHSKLTDAPVDEKLLKETWGSLPVSAARENNIIIANADMMSIPSDKLALAIPYLCKLIVDDRD